MLNIFVPCEICANNNWKEIYNGIIRDGSFGNFTDHKTIIAECLNCGVKRLAEDSCKGEQIYESKDYRCLVNESINSEGFFQEHDKLQFQNLNTVIQTHSLRNKVVADIGCGAGSFLDYVKGLVKEAIAGTQSFVPNKGEIDKFLRKLSSHLFEHTAENVAQRFGKMIEQYRDSGQM